MAGAGPGFAVGPATNRRGGMENNFLSADPAGNHSFTRIVNHRDEGLRPGKDAPGPPDAAKRLPMSRLAAFLELSH